MKEKVKNYAIGIVLIYDLGAVAKQIYQFFTADKGIVRSIINWIYNMSFDGFYLLSSAILTIGLIAFLMYDRRRSQREKIAKLEKAIQPSSAFEKFGNSFDGSEYKTAQAELKYLKIKQAHTDKIIEDAGLSKSMQLSKEDAEFYNEYKRVNSEK